MARELFVEKTADDVVCLEGLKVRCRTLVEDLAGSDPSPVLRLAVEAARSSGDTITRELGSSGDTIPISCLAQVRAWLP